MGRLRRAPPKSDKKLWVAVCGKHGTATGPWQSDERSAVEACADMNNVSDGGCFYVPYVFQPIRGVNIYDDGELINPKNEGGGHVGQYL